jgi:nitrate reductase NapAB chaperone NapD
LYLRKVEILVILRSGCEDGTLLTKYESINNTEGVVPEERVNHEQHQSQQTTISGAQASGMLNTYQKLSYVPHGNRREKFRQVQGKYFK